MMQVKAVAICIFVICSLAAMSQNPWDRLAKAENTLKPEAGTLSFETPGFYLDLLKSSQTVARLSPVLEPGFDFTPSERLEYRDVDGCYHLGDINLRVRLADGAWKEYSTATRRAPVIPLRATPDQLAVADLKPTLAPDFPLTVLRSWERSGEDLVLRFIFKNPTGEPIEIGSLGVPMIFNNILSGKSLEETHVQNVFYDPYIGQHAGYIQVVRLHGQGPVLLVFPEGNTGLEAYNPLNDDPTPRGITFEGFHEWMVHSKAHAETDWSRATPWNEPTSVVVQPGASLEYAFRLTLTSGVRDIETKLLEKHRPVAVGVPGYVLPKEVDGSLFLKYEHPVKELRVSPLSALTIVPMNETSSGWTRYQVKGNVWGRARLTVVYADGLAQTIQYKVIHSEKETLTRMGNFLLTKQWYENDLDPFERSPSVMNYDYERKMIVEHDSRAWIAGLGDEGGSGPWLAAMMKQHVLPDPEEVKKLTRFVHETLWGGIQYSVGHRKYGVRKSLYYYEPEKMPDGTYSSEVNYQTWAAWNKEHSESTDRSYNYPHVTAAHWVMYRLSRFRQQLVTEYNWEWYLENAYHTAMAMVEQAPHYAQFGQMEGTVFVVLLKDLRREGKVDLATALEAVMKRRTDLWRSLAYPFGSEMPWDSTGQEEVYLWSRFFGYDEKAEVTLSAILAYMPTVPHWGYNGSARRYWDFLYGGKLQRVERQLHHYGSALNAIPVLQEYQMHPEDFYLLRVGYGGLLGGISNITKEGFAPAAFHSYPSKLAIDALSGDYGTGFLGYALNTTAYLCQHPEFGWLGFGGNVSEDKGDVMMDITTAARSAVYVAPVGLLISLDAGQVEQVAYNQRTGEVNVTLSPSDSFTPQAYLRYEQRAGKNEYKLSKSFAKQSGAFKIPLTKRATVVKLIPVK